MTSTRTSSDNGPSTRPINVVPDKKRDDPPVPYTDQPGVHFVVDSKNCTSHALATFFTGNTGESMRAVRVDKMMISPLFPNCSPEISGSQDFSFTFQQLQFNFQLPYGLYDIGGIGAYYRRRPGGVVQQSETFYRALNLWEYVATSIRAAIVSQIPPIDDQLVIECGITTDLSAYVNVSLQINSTNQTNFPFTDDPTAANGFRFLTKSPLIGTDVPAEKELGDAVYTMQGYLWYSNGVPDACTIPYVHLLCSFVEPNTTDIPSTRRVSTLGTYFLNPHYLSTYLSESIPGPTVQLSKATVIPASGSIQLVQPDLRPVPDSMRWMARLTLFNATNA